MFNDNELEMLEYALTAHYVSFVRNNNTDTGKIYANSIKGLLDKLEAVRAK